MRNWKIAGFIATLVISLSIPVYYLKMDHRRMPRDASEDQQPAAFSGSVKCRDCHKKVYDKWVNSHHDRAMAAADADTVLGDFNDVEFDAHGTTSRFFRKDGRFFVHTQGPDGEMGTFQITHTFGWYPLQQYLIPFPGGRMQCLPIAWDAREKRWYHLYSDQPPDPSDWLYWTNAGQNWNGMCAECHSTNLKKNYAPETDTYQTTWSDINVGCESCHGPGSRHVDWAEMPDMARPSVENHGLVVKTAEINSRELVELCAPCHSRRAALGDYTHVEPDLLDSMLPSLLQENLYFPDGQILEEVYVYGSFTQSKMYHREVRCSDCHDVHSAKRIRDGNDLCLQCHRAKVYDTKAHHFHKLNGEKGEPLRSKEGDVLFEVGTGAQCVECHMPGRVYMGVDYRPDHSFRIPRPDLSIELGVPNACNRCHRDKTAQWSDETITKWYGPGRVPHYGTTLSAGRNRQPDALGDLLRLAGDPLYPVIVRSTALSLLGAYPGKDRARAVDLALMDEEALIRRTAVDIVESSDPKKLAERIGPLLYDPVKAVRMEAASQLAGRPSAHLNTDQKKRLQVVLKEFVDSMTYSADFASARYNLGNLYASLDRPEEAIPEFRAAVEIDNLFYPARVNLAMLYNQRGEKDEAESLLREVTAAHPELYQIAYSLGLLLAELKKYDEAVVFMERAATGMPEHPRIQYNLGLLHQQLGQDAAAEKWMLKALTLDSGNMDYLYALADFYLKRGRLERAKEMAKKMTAGHPGQRIGHELLAIIEKMMQQKTP